jgi:hypothetical protein
MSQKKFSSLPVLTKTGAESKVRSVDAKEETVVVFGKPKHVGPAVSGYVMTLSEEKRLKEEKEVFAETLRIFSRQVRDYFTNEENEHRKTYRILGNAKNKFQYSVDASENDKFSYSKDKEDMNFLKKALGDVFEDLFEENIIIAIKKSVMDNKKKRKELSMKLLEMFGKEGIIEYFDRNIEWELKKGLADTKHTLTKKVQDILNKNLKQAADTLKDSSKEI